MKREELIKAVEWIVNRAEDCPNCDNSGYTVKQISERCYVTRDMASDACDPSLERQLYSDDEYEQEQCQWCYETPNSKFNLATAIVDSIKVDEDAVYEALDNAEGSFEFNCNWIRIATNFISKADIIRIEEEK